MCAVLGQLLFFRSAEEQLFMFPRISARWKRVWESAQWSGSKERHPPPKPQCRLSISLIWMPRRATGENALVLSSYRGLCGIYNGWKALEIHNHPTTIKEEDMRLYSTVQGPANFSPQVSTVGWGGGMESEQAGPAASHNRKCHQELEPSSLPRSLQLIYNYTF